MGYYLVKLRNGKKYHFMADMWETVNNRVNFYWNGLCLECFLSREVKIVKVISEEEYEKGLESASEFDYKVKLLEDLIIRFTVDLRYEISEWSDERPEDIIKALNEALEAYKEKWEE